MNRRLTAQESRHKLVGDVCHGKHGTIHQAYRDSMEDQLGALGLVLNATVLCRSVRWVSVGRLSTAWAAVSGRVGWLTWLGLSRHPAQQTEGALADGGRGEDSGE